MSWVYATLLAETAVVSLLLTGEQPVRTLWSSVMACYTWQHVVSVRLWNIVWIVICNTLSKHKLQQTSLKFLGGGNPLSAVLCKTLYRRMTNFRITGAATSDSCCVQGTGQLDLFTKKKIITSFWDWCITCIKQYNQWTNIITFINTTASHTLQRKSGLVLQSHWNTTFDHCQRTSSAVQYCT